MRCKMKPLHYAATVFISIFADRLAEKVAVSFAEFLPAALGATWADVVSWLIVFSILACGFAGFFLVVLLRQSRTFRRYRLILAFPFLAAATVAPCIAGSIAHHVPYNLHGF